MPVTKPPSISVPARPSRLIPAPSFLRRGLLALAGLILAGSVIVTVGVYVIGWESRWVEGVTRILPFSAASGVRYHDYAIERRAVGQYTQRLASEPDTSYRALSADQVRAEALTKLIRETAVVNALSARDIMISTADVDQAYTAELSQLGGQAEVAKTLQEYYGWTPEEFKLRVIRGAVAREKLREHLAFDQTANTLERQQAERVLALVKKGDEPFEALAKTYSQDRYADSGGEMEWFGRGTYAREIEEAAFELEPGAVSDAVQTKYGWHIIRLLERRNQNGEEQVRIAQIFIAAPAVDTWLTQELKQRGVRIYIPGLHWDEKSGRAVPRS